MSVCVCFYIYACVRATCALTDTLGVDDGKQAANLEQNQSLRGIGV